MNLSKGFSVRLFKNLGLIPAFFSLGLVLMFATGCLKKGDFRSQDEKISIHHNNCDYSQSTFFYSYPDPVIDTQMLLFDKQYLPGTFILSRITLGFLNNLNYYGSNIASFKFIYQAQKMIIVSENGVDTLAVFDFKPNGQVLQARACTFGFPVANPMAFPNQVFQFSYAGNRLKEIKVKDYWLPNQAILHPYAQVSYDEGFKNPSQIHFFALGEDAGTITYQYDYTKKANDQFYPDECQGDYFKFWYFLKYLNIFPELEPQNMLVESFHATNQYPGDLEKFYSNHVFDAAGHLTAYRVTYRGALSEDWSIQWECGSK